MIAKDLIVEDIPALKLSDTGERAIRLMEEHKVSHLPIVNKDEYLGLVAENELLDLGIESKTFETCKMSLMRPFILDKQHFYEAIKLFSSLNLTALPVLNDQQKFIGTIPFASLLKEFSLLAATQDPGGIIVLEMNEHDYSMTQISQIIEGNDAKILSLYLNNLANTTKIEVTLKVNKTDLSGILQTFYRFNYTVKASFYQSGYKDDLKNRFYLFMNYLNM